MSAAKPEDGSAAAPTRRSGRQGGARPRLRGALPGAPARRLLVLLLPGREPPRRRGPHRADLPAGLPALRARAARVQRQAAAAVADPDRAQPRLELPPRPRPASRPRRWRTSTRSRTRTTTEQVVEGREELREVIDGLTHLPDDRREALIMRFALGMDNREIARALGRTDGATKVLIHRAIKQLEEQLEPSERRRTMTEAASRAPTSRRCSRRAAADRPARGPPRRASRRRLDGHRGRGDRALRVGRRALGVRARVAARPAQLGPPGRGRRRRRRRRNGARPARAAAASAHPRRPPRDSRRPALASGLTAPGGALSRPSAQGSR